jgi:trehalose 6-phosphate synthase
LANVAGLITEPPRDDTGDRRAAQSLVVVAHRGPVQFATRDGRTVVERGAGGLVTALRHVARNTESMRWICAAASDADRLVAARERWSNVPLGDGSCLMHMVDIDPDAHHAFYAVIANPLLWFIQHNLWDHALAPDITTREWDAWVEGYVAVNRKFARALTDLDDVPAHSTVMIQDYHFYLVPEMVRATRPDLFLHHFTHIPWPQPEAWRLLPPRMREAVFRGLLGCDIVGFHTLRYVRNFLLGCEELLGAEVDFATSTVLYGGRETVVRHYPISVDEASLLELAATPEVTDRRAGLASMRAEKMVLRVDRTDPSKNIVRGFKAFARMLERHPELCGRVAFLALLQPSRQDVPQYAAYLREIHETVDAINARFATPTWTPIDLRLADDLPSAIAAYATFDVLMVNPVFDGMNLVAKEALLLNETGGVLALSENAGAHAELGAVAITLHPFDIEQQADALYEALLMPLAERQARQEMGAAIVRTNDVQKWLQQQLSDIELLRGATARS